MQIMASQVAQLVNNLPTETEDARVQFQYLGWEDPLEKEMATHSTILAWKIPWIEESGGWGAIVHKTTAIEKFGCIYHLVV